MEKILNFLKDIIKPKNWLKILGLRIFSTVFYLGYLPDWNRHWSAALSVLTSIILIFNFANVLSPSYIAYLMLLKFIYIFFITLIFVPLFRIVYKQDNLDVITIDSFLAQIFVFAFCIPAISHIDSGITNLLIKACNSFLYCNQYIFIISRVFLTLLGPFLVLRFFDALEFWPTGYLILYFKNSYIRLIAGLFPAIYASIFIYLFCFLFFDLEIIEVINFYKVIFSAVFKHFYIIFFFIIKMFSAKSIYIFLKKIGVIYILDKYGIINAKHYDLKFDIL